MLEGGRARIGNERLLLEGGGVHIGRGGAHFGNDSSYWKGWSSFWK